MKASRDIISGQKSNLAIFQEWMRLEQIEEVRADVALETQNKLNLFINWISKEGTHEYQDTEAKHIPQIFFNEHGESEDHMVTPLTALREMIRMSLTFDPLINKMMIEHHASMVFPKSGALTMSSDKELFLNNRTLH